MGSSTRSPLRHLPEGTLFKKVCDFLEAEPSDGREPWDDPDPTWRFAILSGIADGEKRLWEWPLPAVCELWVPSLLKADGWEEAEIEDFCLKFPRAVDRMAQDAMDLAWHTSTQALRDYRPKPPIETRRCVVIAAYLDEAFRDRERGKKRSRRALYCAAAKRLGISNRVVRNQVEKETVSPLALIHPNGEPRFYYGKNNGAAYRMWYTTMCAKILAQVEKKEASPYATFMRSAAQILTEEKPVLAQTTDGSCQPTEQPESEQCRKVRTVY